MTEIPNEKAVNFAVSLITPGHPRIPQDSIICMFNILYERVDEGLVLVCWIRLSLLISLDEWMDGKRTDTTKHGHATDY